MALSSCAVNMACPLIKWAAASKALTRAQNFEIFVIAKMKSSRTVSKALDVHASGAFAFVSVGLVATSFSMKPVGSDLLIRVKASRVALHAGTQQEPPPRPV